MVDKATIVAEVKSSWASIRVQDIVALGDVAKKLKPDIALLAVMDKGRQHEQALQKLEAELAALNITLQLITLDTHPLENDSYLS